MKIIIKMMTRSVVTSTLLLSLLNQNHYHICARASDDATKTLQASAEGDDEVSNVAGTATALFFDDVNDNFQNNNDIFNFGQDKDIDYQPAYQQPTYQQPQSNKNQNQPNVRQQPKQNQKKGPFGFGGKGNQKKPENNGADGNIDEIKRKSMDYFEKLIARLSKVENHTEAIIIGCGLMLVGIIFIFVGAKSLQVVFGIIMSLVISMMMTLFLCILFDVKWDSELGVGLSGISFLLSAPFVQYGLKFSDKFAVPLVAGLSLAAIAQISLNVAKVSDEPPYHFKTVSEGGAFILGFLIALKVKEYIAMLVTSFFGAFTCTMAGSLIINKMPQNQIKYNKKGKIVTTETELLQIYLPYMIVITILTVVGFMYQREQYKNESALSAQQDQLQQRHNAQSKMQKPSMGNFMPPPPRPNMPPGENNGMPFGGTGMMPQKDQNIVLNSSTHGDNSSEKEVSYVGDQSLKLLDKKFRENMAASDLEKQSFLNKF